MITHYQDLKVVESAGEFWGHDPFPRTWKERLFTWPWTPWKSEKMVKVSRGYMLPDGQFQIDKVNRVMYANPNSIKQLEQAIQNDGNL